MADVNAEIGVSIDTSSALAQLKSLQREIARFHTSVAKSSDAAALAQRDLQKNFINGVNAIQGFSAELRTVKTTAENFTTSLEKNKFSMREYFRYAGASTKTFGRSFTAEFDTINKVAVENVKRLQTQYIKMGRDATGAMRAIAIMPTELDMSNLTTQTQIAAQRQAIFNQLVRQGSTNLLNFGKNTQWAGRQLMVGFTLPLMGLGAVAAKTFMDMETATIKFRKVYGDLFTPTEETQQALSSIQEVGKEFTKFGIQVADTVSLAADAAAAGFSGVDLQRQVTEATRLQVLGQIDQQKALETTISLQNAFRMSSEDLAESINFLNAVENQTVVSLDDITTAIPKAAPIVRELGGDIKDLAFFMAAMKEGGINASEGANALKSGLASLINPTDKAKGMLNDMGIDIDNIVESNVGNLKATVIEFARALDGLSNLQRQRAIEQLFGKFQQARLSALFDNVIRDGNQASRVLDLANASAADLAATAEKELGITAESAMNKFRSAVEQVKLSLVPIGEAVLQVITPLLERLNSLLEWFNGLSDSTKKVITRIVLYLGGLAPVILMSIGLLANFVANGIKGLMLLRNGFLRLTGQSQVLGEQTQFLTVEQQNAVAAAASLEQSHIKLQQAFTGEAGAVRQLITEYQKMIAAQNLAATRFPGMMQPGFRAKGYAKGVVSVPGPKGAGDVVPAMLSPGESVIPAKMTQKYGGLINAMISDKIPGFKKGLGLGSLKKEAGLYKAPPAVLVQTGAMNWETAAAEIQAVTDATRELGLTQAQMFNLTRKQASHIAEDIRTIQVGNEATAIKNWKAQNLIADMGYINNYVDTLRKNTTIIDNFRKTNLDRTAQVLNISMQELDAELDRLRAGLHPITRRSAQVLQQVAMTDPGYQGVAASAGLRARLAGNFYETIPARAYSPKYDPVAETTTNKRVAKLQMLAGQKMADNTINSLAVAAGVRSPSRRTIPIGEDIARGLQVGMLNQVDETRAVANQLSGAASGLINPSTGKLFTQQEIANLRRVTKKQVKQKAGKFGPAAPAGTQFLPITTPLTRGEKISNSMSRMVGMGGSMAMLGGNMALGMAPDFSGKGMIQGGLTGGMLGMMGGTLKTTAIGAGIGVAIAAMSSLIAKQKEYEAVARSTFTASSEMVGLFGQKVLDTSLKITTFAENTKRITNVFGVLNPEVQKFVDEINKLPEDNPVQIMIKNIAQTDMSALSVAGNILTNVTDAIATKGLDPANAENYVKAILAAANRTRDFAAVWEIVQKSVGNSADATTKNLDKLNEAVVKNNDAWFYNYQTTQPIAKGYGDLSQKQKILADQMMNLFAITSNGSLKFKELTARLDGIKQSSVNSKIGVAALSAAINNSGNADAIARLKQIEGIFKNAGIAAKMSAADVLMFNAVLNTIGTEGILEWGRKNGFVGPKGTGLGMDMSQLIPKYFESPEFKKAIAEQNKVMDALNGVNTGGGGGGARKFVNPYDKEIKLLNKKRDALKEVNDELNRQNQYQMKQMDLLNQAAKAKMTGDYLQAASLQQQAMFEGAQFTRESRIVQMDRVIKAASERQDIVGDTKKLTSADKNLLEKLKSGNYSSIVPMPTTPNVGFGAKTGTDTGTTKNIGGTVYNVTMNVTGANAEEISNKVIAKLKVVENKNNKTNKVAK